MVSCIVKKKHLAIQWFKHPLKLKHSQKRIYVQWVEWRGSETRGKLQYKVTQHDINTFYFDDDDEQHYDHHRHQHHHAAPCGKTDANCLSDVVSATVVDDAVDAAGDDVDDGTVETKNNFPNCHTQQHHLSHHYTFYDKYPIVFVAVFRNLPIVSAVVCYKNDFYHLDSIESHLTDLHVITASKILKVTKTTTTVIGEEALWPIHLQILVMSTTITSIVAFKIRTKAP